MKKHLIPCLIFLSLWLSSQSEIRFEKYDIRDGLSQTIVNCIAQDQRGFLWIGTQDGLNRFDGYNFQVFKPDPFDKNSISGNFINNILVDSKGDLWLSTELGLTFYDQQVDSFIQISNNINDPKSISDNEVNHVLETSHGDFWIATENGGLNFLSKENRNQHIFEFKTFSSEQRTWTESKSLKTFEWNGQILISGGGGLFVYDELKDSIIPMLQNEAPFEHEVNAFSEIQGKLWIGTINGAFEVQIIGNQLEVQGSITSRNGLKSNAIISLYGENNVVWVGGLEGLAQVSLSKSDTVVTNIKSNAISNYATSKTKISSFLLDDFGSLWIGTDRGLNRFDSEKSQFMVFSHDPNDPSTLLNNTVWSFTKQDSLLYIGTAAGLSIKNDHTNEFTHLIEANSDVPSGAIMCLFADSKKRIWVGGREEGLSILTLKNGAYHFEKLNHLEEGKVDGDLSTFCVLEDHKGRFWLGSRQGITLFDESLKVIHRFTKNMSQSSISENIVRCIYQDKRKNIWIGTDGGGLNKVIETTDGVFNFEIHNYSNENKNGLNNPMVLAITEDKEGDIWMATYGGGLNKFSIKEGTFSHITEKESLSNNVAYGLIKDRKGFLWTSTNRGINQINPKDKTVRIFTEKSGLQSDEFNVGAYFMDNDGKIYFGGINGFNSFFPSNIKRNSVPPKIAFTGISLFNESLDLNVAKQRTENINESYVLNLNYRQNTLNFEFVGLHFASSEDNWYKYKLEGVNEDWIIGKNRRFASYSNLSYGEYIFMVSSANSDRTWNDEYAKVYINIAPPYWHTWWFRALCGFFVLALIFGVYFSRLAIIKSQKKLLEQQVSARTQKVLEQKKKIEKQKDLIEQEKYKAEQLLLNILPAETANELIKTGKASPRHYRMVSVLFCDFKGFTKIAEQLRPKDLVQELDNCFNSFDDIMEKHNLEKIKTSGDSYMAAGGVPIRNKTNPIDMVLAAMDIQRFMAKHKEEKEKLGLPTWELRLGIHTGEVITGVVGKKKFAYDIWGDTVNTAARMESSSEPGKINISGSTYKHIKDYFKTEYRGKVPAKNKGDIDMYFVTGIVPELSKTGKGLLPNIRFMELMNFNIYSKLNYNKVRKSLLADLEENLPDNLHYHGVHHTRDVVRSAERIAKSEGMDEESVMLIKTAALFHDAGFLRKYWKNEPQGVELAKEILPNNGFSIHQIDIIEGMILATAIPQDPKNIYEEILCDADLDYLGRDDFNDIANTLCQELIEYGKIRDAKEWDPIQVKFLSAHKYFTKTNKETRTAGKLANLEMIKQRIPKG